MKKFVFIWVGKFGVKIYGFKKYRYWLGKLLFCSYSKLICYLK